MTSLIIIAEMSIFKRKGSFPCKLQTYVQPLCCSVYLWFAMNRYLTCLHKETVVITS